MLTTSRRGIQYPNTSPRSDRPDIPLHLKYLADKLDLDVVYDHGTNASRLAAAHQAGGGRFWWTTDTLQMWYDDGVTWRSIGSGNLLDRAFLNSTPSGVTVTTEGTAATFINGNSVTYDGTEVLIQVYVPKAAGTISGAFLTVVVTKDGTSIGQAGTLNVSPSTNGGGGTVSIFDTPAAGGHVYGSKVFTSGGTVTLTCGAGGPSTMAPAWLRVVKL